MKVEVLAGEDNEESAMRMSDGAGGEGSDGNQQKIKSVHIMTPDIINGTIKTIEVQDERYHNVMLKFDDN